MIYSCTMFFNEFDLLDLKIAEEIESIDRLVIVEADKTHSNQPKPLQLSANKKYKHPKIQIVVVGKEFNSDSYFNEGLQRNAALSVIDLQDDDVLVCNDLDEINKADDIPNIVAAAREHGLVRMAMFHYYYKINLVTGLIHKWHLPFAVTGKYLRESHKTLTDIRRKETLGVVINTDGRHFGYLGSAENVAYKIKSFLHTNYNQPRFTNLDSIEKRIKEHRDPYERITLLKVDVDDKFPKTILNNMDYWRKYMEA